MMPTTPPLRIATVTISDRSSTGERQDLSGPAIQQALEAAGLPVRMTHARVIPDNEELIRLTLVELSDLSDVDVVITTGGTGLTPRDVTPRATSAVLEYEVPGIAEAMRAASLLITPMAMLSRAVAGVRNQRLIVNLPGSPRAVAETLVVVAPVLPHAVASLRGLAGDHG